MKKFKVIPIICFVLSLCCCLFVFKANSKIEKVQAASSNTFEITDNNYSSYMEKPLYDAIKSVAKQLNFNQPVTGFSSDIFSFGYNDYQPLQSWYDEQDSDKRAIYMNNIAKSDEIKAYLNQGVLDLTIGKEASFSCLNNSLLNKINNITGLNNLSLDTIKTLKINNANINKISNTDFSTLDNINSLSLKNSNISSFNLGNTLKKLTNIDLSGNKLSEIDLSSVVYNGKYLTCNLSLNEFNDLSKVIAPTSTKFDSLNLSFNKLEDITTSQLEAINNKINSNKVFLGVQGLTDFENVTAGDILKVYNSENSTITDLKLEVYYFEGNQQISASEFYEEDGNNLICELVGSNSGQNLVFPAGKLKLVFLSNNKEINVDNFPMLDEDLIDLFSSKVILSKLPAPNYTLTVDGKVVSDKYQKSDIKVEFTTQNSSFANYQDVAENCKIFSAISDKFSTEPANIINIVENGTFKCSAYIIFDGVKSDITSVEITRKNYTGVMWGVIIIISMIIIGSAVYYIIRWYREGATVAPLSDKEIYRLNKKKASYENISRDERISQLDKSRHTARVSDINYDNDQIYEDLNSYNDYSSSYSSEDNEYEDNEIDRKDETVDSFSMPEDINE